MKIMLLILVFLILLGSGYGQCSRSNTTFLKNKRILLDLFIKNTPLHDGFYSASVGNNSDQVYGVSQCKANVSSNVCANCLKLYIRDIKECPGLPFEESVSSLCTTKICNRSVFGVWSNNSFAGYGNKGLEKPLVFSKGFSMMQDLANTVPYQPLMFQTAEIDVGVDGKRYGFAQCGRDLSKLTCQNCLEDRLQRYRSYVENRSGWEILGSSCSMRYSNVSHIDDNLNLTVVGISSSAFPSDGQVPTGLPSDGQIPTGSVTPESALPSDEKVPPASVTSGTQRCHGGIVIETSIWISILTLLLFASQLFHLS